jgi:hypothetical protein
MFYEFATLRKHFWEAIVVGIIAEIVHLLEFLRLQNSFGIR